MRSLAWRGELAPQPSSSCGGLGTSVVIQEPEQSGSVRQSVKQSVTRSGNTYFCCAYCHQTLLRGQGCKRTKLTACGADGLCKPVNN